MAENIVKNEVLNHGEGVAEVTNWISQIKAGETVYDIATHHGITFKDGKNDGTGVKWNGLTDLEIVIPNITDIVQTPIEFAGTVGADGNITWNADHTDGPKTGYLVFVTADCTFAEKACEAGDMAIYDGENWNIVSGENQVSIVGTMDNNRATIAIGASKDVLTVEGKTLALTLDYADLNGHVSKTKGETENVVFGNMTVGSKYIDLSKGNDIPKTIGKIETIQKASNLTNGNVTFAGINTLVTDVNWGTFNPGSLHEIVMNTDARTFAVTGGSIAQTEDQHFVTNVSLGKVTFGTAVAGDEDKFSLVNGITAVSGQGQVFVTGIDGKTNFTVAGCLQPTDGKDAKYVKGIEGNYVTGLTTGGSFSLGEGDKIAIGFGTAASSGDVLSSVTVSANNDTTVLNTASVSNHVLSFGTTEVTSGVTVSSSYKSLKTTGYTFTPAAVSTATFVNGGFKKADDVTYTLNTNNETTYTTTSAYYKLTTPQLGVTKGGYALSNTGMVANVSANTFAVDVTGGALPSLGTSTVVRGANVTGSVATDLDYTDVTINAVDPNAMTINLPGAYTLVSTSGTGVEVGMAGELVAKGATINLEAYLKDVAIVETKVSANA